MQHDPSLAARGSAPAALTPRFRRLAGFAEAEATWRALEAKGGLVSPGQSFDVCRLWCETLGVPKGEIVLLLAEAGDQPLALLPLRRIRVRGTHVLGWMLGNHVGANAPLLDPCRFGVLSSEARADLWAGLARLSGADLLFLRDMPIEMPDRLVLEAELGSTVPSDTLYRAHFSSFAEADAVQRNKSRRKHDRQQGDKLAALGSVNFETIANGDPEFPHALETLFRQRAERFAQMGICDPFAEPGIRAAYAALAAPGSGVDVRMALLRLDGEIVAARYCIHSGAVWYCLISSMSTEPRLQPGSPGKQCLLNVMQRLFEQGEAVLDMGSGLNDEKRHWCNEQIQLVHRYLPVTARGRLLAAGHRQVSALRRLAKDNDTVRSFVYRARAALARLRGRS
ncbi:Acetyltransferase involved in cellulose biosynthesis, CelD/BcsL family [Devosia enhydra]|uniref:Acetyltransferase involved in cellulose biosynthesis, CelD/BcsL family n=1 Tax=Devosia enhydra TaxID=665118 RepID=A0A1K2HU63_9HYPH|nr:GNAT family N-acetyltransferase [Devosia enhydra]SFZ80986.1 Acetyltransferase involved in cellulose biosynthesis, CelD/BcsL family [Devosia enhydra]